MKKPISATIDTNLIKWLDNVLRGNNAFRNKSHVIELALEEFREKNNKKR